MEVTLRGTPDEIRAVLSPASGWIPVSERMPEEGVIVLVCRRKVDGRLVSGVGKQSGGRWWVYESAARKVEYWQPIPPPPFQEA